jgi:hypothetical protein
LLRQAFAHCGKLLAAASRRSGGRVSVPLWLAVLSDQLPIIALVGRYPTNKLIGRRPLHRRINPFLTSTTSRRAYAELPRVSAGYPPPMGRFPTCSSPVRHVNPQRGHVRLACIRHAASVNPEPGSNSPPKMLPASPKEAQDFVSLFRASIHDRQIFPHSHRNRTIRRVGPPSSAARLDQDHSPASCETPSAFIRQPTCQCARAVHNSRLSKEKPPLEGRAPPSLDVLRLGLDRL